MSSRDARDSRVRRLLFVGTNRGPGGTESHLVSLAIAMFLVAGLTEGLFRQLVLDVHARWTAAGGTLAFWLLYFLLAGRSWTGWRAWRG